LRYDQEMENFAFIDGQNLYSGVQSLGWSLDLRKFRVHLEQKYHVTRAFYFLGYMPENASLYQRLQGFGYELEFKPVVQGRGHDPKGNVDADLVLKTMIELPNYDQAVIITGDGDYYSLVAHLGNVGKLGAVLAPNRKFCSSLLRRSAAGSLRYVEDIRNLVAR
jgi:uncharacterized LabA/DUF88 family protein